MSTLLLVTLAIMASTNANEAFAKDDAACLKDDVTLLQTKIEVDRKHGAAEPAALELMEAAKEEHELKVQALSELRDLIQSGDLEFEVEDKAFANLTRGVFENRDHLGRASAHYLFSLDDIHSTTKKSTGCVAKYTIKMASGFDFEFDTSSCAMLSASKDDGNIGVTAKACGRTQKTVQIFSNPSVSVSNSVVQFKACSNGDEICLTLKFTNKGGCQFNQWLVQTKGDIDFANTKKTTGWKTIKTIDLPR
jgi:hypothetical protein